MKIDTTAKIDQSRNSYCGPLVLAAILGITTAEAAAKIRGVNFSDVRKRVNIKGVKIDELMRTLHAYGYRMQPFAVTKTLRTYRGFGRNQVKHVGPTFAAWLRSRGRTNVPHTFIVLLKRHYVLVKGRKMVDTHTDGEWRFIRKAPHRRKRVRATWLVYPIQPVETNSYSAGYAYASGYHD